MGLSIVLERHRTKDREIFVSMDDRTKSRVTFGVEISRFYNSYFKAKNIEVWKFAPLEELNGTLLKTIEVEKEFVTRQDEANLWHQLQSLPIVDRFFSVIQIHGKWQMDNVQFDAYVSIANDPNWRRIYGDVELNAFPTTEIKDIVDLFYKNDALKERLVDFFLTSFAKFDDGIHQIGGIFFSLGVPSPEDFDLWRTAVLKSETTLLEDAIIALKATGGEEIQRALSPYSIPYLVRNLRETPMFSDTLNDFFRRSHILEKEVGSIGYIGEDQESFKKFFNEFAEKVLKPVVKSLPPEREISFKIRNAVQKQSALD